MLFTLRTTHMPAAGWRQCVDGVEIVWRCTCAHPQDTGATGQATAARMKEKPRDMLNLRAALAAACECNVWDRLFAFYGSCHQHEDIPELINLVKTIAR
jgi:hypothetical protein